jgi:hypothetical protein
MTDAAPVLWSEAWWRHALTHRQQGIGWKPVCEQHLHLKYNGSFTARLKEARLRGWLPAEEDLPPAIRRDGKRVGVSARGARLVQGPVQTSAPRVDASADYSAETSAENHAPVQTPVQRTDTGAVSSVDTDAVQVFDTAAVQRLDRLEDEVQGLAQVVRSLVDRMNRIPEQTPVQITTLPPYPKGKAVRWNLWILDAIQDELKIMAAERDVSPSQLVQELLWAALAERRRPPEGIP